MNSGLLKKLGNLENILESNKNENTAYQNFWDLAKVDLRANCVDITVHALKIRGTEPQSSKNANPKCSRWKNYERNK